MGTFSEDRWRWDFKWRRNLFDHENDLAVNFMEDITSISIQRYGKDTMMWKVESSGVYSTKSAYRLMLNTNASGSDVRNFKLIWKMKVPQGQQFSLGGSSRTGYPFLSISFP